MAVPRVHRKLLGELEEMGFPVVRATRALHFSGRNGSLEDVISWTVDHENDPNIAQMPLVLVDIAIESSEPSQKEDEVTMIAKELRLVIERLASDRAHENKEEEEKHLEKEKEKTRIRAGKQLLEAKRIQEENERKRNIDFRKAEKEESKRARDRIRQKLEQDKLERRSRLGRLPAKRAAVLTNPAIIEQGAKNALLPHKSTVKPGHLRDCLRTLKCSHKKDDDATVKRAFQTPMVYVRNVAKNPDEEKFRKIRLSNPHFQDRVGSLKGGVEFLELVGFERTEGGNYLYLPRDKIDMKILNSAGSELGFLLSNRRPTIFSCPFKTYADLVEAGVDRSIKDRLNGNSTGLASRNGQIAGKRRRADDDDKWQHDLYKDNVHQVSRPEVGARDLRLKLQRKGLQSKGSNTGVVRDLRERLSGIVSSQRANTDLPKSNSVTAAGNVARKSVAVAAPVTETKKVAKPAAKRKKDDTSVDGFLDSLGLDKYNIMFQAEEIDMTALLHMTDSDLKDIGVPMGPRKKILLALESRA